MSTAVALPVEIRPSERIYSILSNTSLLGGACSVLVLAPLCFGAVQSWAIFGLETCAAVLVFMWAVRQWISKELHVVPNPLYAPMLAFLTLIVLQLLLGTTAYRQVTYSRLLLYISYGMLAFITTQSLRRSTHVRTLAWVVCSYGCVVALFALVQGLLPNGKLYWIWSLQHGGSIYGPYVNHNHYAGLIEMLIPLPLVLAVSRFAREDRKIAVTGIAALMAGTIFLSGSRGGMFAFVAQVIFLVVLLRPNRTNWKQPALLAAILGIMIALLLWIGGNEFTRRLASIHSEARQELSGGTRLTVDADGLRMWKNRPLLGWGLGAFPDVYPQFRSFYTSFMVNDAHNDYVQLLTETGLTGFAIAVWFLVLTFRHAWAKLSQWTETVNGLLTVTSILGVVGILVHSFLDFNLQIPANAALFYVLCAIAASTPLNEAQRRRVRRRNFILEPSFDATNS